MTNHSPLPWKIGGSNESNIWSDSGQPIASLDFKGMPNRANAAYIVRAVNAHEELVSLVKVYVKAMQLLKDEADSAYIIRAVNAHEELVKLLTEQISDYEMMDQHRITATDKDWLSRARRLIAKAEGK